MNFYDDGDLVRARGTFTDEDGTPQDPEEVAIQHRFGNSESVTKIYGTDVEVVREDVGIYYMMIDTTGSKGMTCRYRVYSTGNGQTAEEGRFFVRQSPLA